MNYTVTEEVRQFLTPVREFTLHNAADEPILIMYSGETRVIPAINQITYPHPKFDDVCYSAKDSDGDWVPGTLVLRDMVQTFMNQQEGQVWSAANAIKHALDIDIKSGIATGKYAERGVSLLPPDPTKEFVEKISAEGRKRYVAWRLKWAKEVAENYETRIAALKSSGHSPIPLGPDYDRARAIIDAGRDADKAKYAPSYLPAIAQPVEEDDAEALQQLIAKISSAVQATVPGASQTPTAQALVDSLTNNPQAMALLKKKFKVRKLRDVKPAEVA